MPFSEKISPKEREKKIRSMLIIEKFILWTKPEALTLTALWKDWDFPETSCTIMDISGKVKQIKLSKKTYKKVVGKIWHFRQKLGVEEKHDVSKEQSVFKEKNV